MPAEASMTRRWVAALIVAVASLVAAAPASASTIVFQCGEAVCAVDPDGGGAPRQLTADGRLAGLTRDGRTASWVDSEGLVQAPVSGGAPRRVFEGEVVAQPSMSPDGSRYLYWYPGPDGLGGLNAVWINRVTVAGANVDSVSFCFFCVTSHGWLDDTPIAAFPGRDDPVTPSRVCRLATGAEEPGQSGSCKRVLVSDPRGGIAFPSGNAAGTEIVAALSPGELTGVRGRIVRYSLATGGAVADVTAGTDDTTPVFSGEGDRVAFERGGQIVVKELLGGAERVIGAGIYPFWGGTRTVRVRVAKVLQVDALRGGRATAGVRCAGACRVTASLQVKARTARRLGTSRTIAKATGSRTRAGTVKLRLKATRKAASRLTALSSYRATLRVAVKPRGGAVTGTAVPVRVRR